VAALTLSTLWLVMLAGGLLTYLLRLSFIVLLEHWQMPDLLRRALCFVPAAVFAAIIFPELVMHEGGLNILPTNPRLIAGLLAGLVAWRTKNVLLTIGIGMATLLALQALIK
jgi:branched-subunit amino acid transport protein